MTVVRAGGAIHVEAILRCAGESQLVLEVAAVAHGGLVDGEKELGRIREDVGEGVAEDIATAELEEVFGRWIGIDHG